MYVICTYMCDLDEAVVEVEAEQDGGGGLVGGGGFADHAADYGLQVGAGVGVEPYLQLAF